MSKKKSSLQNTKLGFTENFFLSGTAAAISKTSAAPIERVKLLLQNQNELLKQGKLNQKYSGVRGKTSSIFFLFLKKKKSDLTEKLKIGFNLMTLFIDFRMRFKGI